MQKQQSLTLYPVKSACSCTLSGYPPEPGCRASDDQSELKVAAEHPSVQPVHSKRCGVTFVSIFGGPAEALMLKAAGLLAFTETDVSYDGKQTDEDS